MLIYFSSKQNLLFDCWRRNEELCALVRILSDDSSAATSTGTNWRCGLGTGDDRSHRGLHRRCAPERNWHAGDVNRPEEAIVNRRRLNIADIGLDIVDRAREKVRVIHLSLAIDEGQAGGEEQNDDSKVTHFFPLELEHGLGLAGRLCGTANYSWIPTLGLFRLVFIR